MFNLFGKKLPHCDALFLKYIAGWLPDEYYRKMTRPDMYVIAGYNGEPLDLNALQYLPAGRLQQEKDQIEKMVAAALGDYQSVFPARNFKELDLEVLHTVDQYYDRERIWKLIKKSEPADFSNDYLVSVGEFGALLGKLFIDVGGFGWLYSQPYFNSIIVHKDTGYGITVFDWAVKKFSEYGFDDGFAAKFEAALSRVEQG